MEDAYKISLCNAASEAISWELEREVWNPFNWQARERTASPPYDPQLHLVAIDERDRMIGTIDGCRIFWSGKAEDLPRGGWSEIAELGRAPQQTANYGCAIGASVSAESRSRGLAAELLVALRDQTSALGLEGLLAPVLPSARWQVSHLPLEEYERLRLKDGRHFDPWVRVHESLGGKIIGRSESSARFASPREDWERWFRMRLPEDGEVLLPNAGPLKLENGWGELKQESLWLLHRIARSE